jgi:Fur family ferric uptake transcriptional regulator
VKAGDRSWRFAICSCGSSKHCHPHFICRSCGSVECLQGLQIPAPLKLKPGYRAEELEIYIRGLCARCGSA